MTNSLKKLEIKIWVQGEKTPGQHYSDRVDNWWKKRFRELESRYWNEEACQEFLILASQVLGESE